MYVNTKIHLCIHIYIQIHEYTYITILLAWSKRIAMQAKLAQAGRTCWRLEDHWMPLVEERHQCHIVLKSRHAEALQACQKWRIDGKTPPQYFDPLSVILPQRKTQQKK